MQKTYWNDTHQIKIFGRLVVLELEKKYHNETQKWWKTNVSVMLHSFYYFDAFATSAVDFILVEGRQNTGNIHQPKPLTQHIIEYKYIYFYS